jgi:acetylornithine deacetylase/succinyl-diaminopimelate desuccinylase-like protein
VSKSDFATYTWTLLALQAFVAGGGKLRGTLELHFTYDEEVGGIVGPKWLLDEKLTRPDAAIAAGFSYAIVTAHDGCLHLEVTVTGKQAHAAMPETGVDALEAATGILAALYAHRSGLARIRSATPDQRRHQHQRGPRPGRVSHRPPHDPGRGCGEGGSRAAGADHGRRRAPCAN